MKRRLPHLWDRPLAAEFMPVMFDAVASLFMSTKKADHKQFTTQTTKETECVWIGHATFLINMFGRQIITDPVFSDLALVCKRKVAPSLMIHELPKVDIVVLSHSHFDHMDVRSLAQLDRRSTDTVFVVPKGYHRYMQWMRNVVIELNNNQSVYVKGIKITAHEPKHWTNRFPWQTFEHLNSYAFRHEGKCVFFAGDTAYDKNLHSKFPRAPDVALVPIGAYNPDILQDVHQTPEQAMQLARDIKAKHVIPMHFETFRLSFEAFDEPRKRFVEASKHFADIMTHPLKVGQKVVFTPDFSKGNIH